MNNLGMITLAEAGLDWKQLELRSAHNQRQTKEFPVFSGFYPAVGMESCTARHTHKTQQLSGF